MNYRIPSSYSLPTNCDRSGFVAAGSERVVAADSKRFVAADVADTVGATIAVDTYLVADRLVDMHVSDLSAAVGVHLRIG